MYSKIKQIGKSIFSESVLYQLEPFLRKLVSVFYAGNKVECPICKGSFSKFISIDRGSFFDSLCPQCGSIPRKRLLWLYLNRKVLGQEKSLDMLDFSPFRAMSDRLKQSANLNYTSSDYESSKADKNYDISDIPEPENAFGLIICYHVLEHVPDDRKAMRELYRILKPNGIALLQVPHREEPTAEDPGIHDPAERLRLFGQEDHLRYYNRQDFVNRLKEVGFEVEEVHYAAQLPREEIDRYSLREDEIIFVCRK